MLRRLHQLVLILLSVALVLLPYTEHACDWDRFPTASNDLELQMICCLCAIGMFLVFARKLQFAPESFRPAFIHGFSHLQGFGDSGTQSPPRPSNPVIPLRI
jgi:hypothetical protein